MVNECAGDGNLIRDPGLAGLFTFPLSFPLITSTYTHYSAKQAEYRIATHNLPGADGVGHIYLLLQLCVQSMLNQRVDHSLGVLHSQ